LDGWTIPLKMMQRYWRWSRALTIGVQCCVFDDQSRVLLVRHGYRAGWHFPGGGVEKSETLMLAVTREVEEETGIRPETDPELFGVYANFRTFPHDHIALFVCRDWTRTSEPEPNFEIAESSFCPLDALPEGTSPQVQARLTEILHASPRTQNW
jgi:8-oxo-dGTP pyrophosphatase MutT (NUDIX family)